MSPIIIGLIVWFSVGVITAGVILYYYEDYEVTVLDLLVLPLIGLLGPFLLISIITDRLNKIVIYRRHIK